MYLAESVRVDEGACIAPSIRLAHGSIHIYLNYAKLIESDGKAINMVEGLILWKTTLARAPRFETMATMKCSPLWRAMASSMISTSSSKHRGLSTSITKCASWSQNKHNRLLIKTQLRSMTSNSSGNAEEYEPVNAKVIKAYLQQSSLQFKEGHTCVVTTCPRLNHTKLRLNNVNKMYINSVTGYFTCLKCHKSGTWDHFKTNANNLISLMVKRKRIPGECLSMIEETEDIELSKTAAIFNDAGPIKNLTDEDAYDLKHRLGIHNLSMETLNTFRIRVINSDQGYSLLVPLYDLRDAIVGMKIHTVTKFTVQEMQRNRVVSKIIPKLEFGSLFGWHLMKPKHKSVVLTASEWDAMAIYQVTGVPALALPRGSAFLSQKVLPALEQFSSITLWLDSDVKSWEAAKILSKKLNESRCSLVKPAENQPSPLTALKEGYNISSILKAARPIKHQSITSFRSLRQEVFSTLSESDVVAGVKWKRYPHLNKLLKGHRRGELTVFTGPTGSGKTTFISDYSLDLAMQGVNTLWGSFEINNVKLMKTMLTQFAQMNLVKNIDLFDETADAFESLPLFFMTFHGQEDTKKVIETMSHAVYIHDIQHVIVDNLQFMMGSSSFHRSSTDRFLIQDEIISAFRRFATHMNCHVTLVIHPRKEKDSEDLSMSSIFGSAKATQEADNVLILQDKRLVSPRGKKYIQVAKNRFDGELGVMLLKYDKDSLSFSGISKPVTTSQEADQ
ncbi:hypothetical protein CAPTEDRAFT_220406 [Capitella teleta]|uniref:DNA 5'-3' helicase n=1 Tax=Capitella teleta TaxID=283909 RepID=R7V4A8_CAPTE|nr:hypothetical protein CAPTEDRAFT_220406 [Capitella teleta]|eukprot:ELU13663.1 hypothetical protein CAPTEDRAFT_220406 [Capitella teleta]